MLTHQDFTVEQKVQFTTHALIGGTQTFEGTVLGIINPLALPASSNAALNHSNIWPSIPTEDQDLISDDFKSYNYLVLSTGTAILYIGLPWILDGSLTVVSNRVVTLQLNNFEDPNFTRLKSILTVNGYEVLSVSES